MTEALEFGFSCERVKQNSKFNWSVIFISRIFPLSFWLQLLHRYEDLLPRGYTFHPDPFYQLTAIDHTRGLDQDGTAQTDARSVTDLCLLHTLKEASRTAKSAGDPTPNPAVTLAWATRYDRFLFEFLQKHHKSRFTETACHVSIHRYTHKHIQTQTHTHTSPHTRE